MYSCLIVQCGPTFLLTKLYFNIIISRITYLKRKRHFNVVIILSELPHKSQSAHSA